MSHHKVTIEELTLRWNDLKRVGVLRGRNSHVEGTGDHLLEVGQKALTKLYNRFLKGFPPRRDNYDASSTGGEVTLAGTQYNFVFGPFVVDRYPLYHLMVTQPNRGRVIVYPQTRGG